MGGQYDRYGGSALPEYPVNAQENKKLLSDAEIVSVVIDENDFNKKAGVNFFIGEFSKYLQSIRVECLINKSLDQVPLCSKALYLVPEFQCKEYLKSNGIWVYQFTGISLFFMDNCPEQQKKTLLIRLDNIESNTTINSLVSIFSQKLNLYK